MTDITQREPHKAADLEPHGKLESNVLKLHAEHAIITKRTRRVLVRATRTTRSREEMIEGNLAHEHVVVERVPIGEIVDAVPLVRQEGDVTIMPVVEEIVVVERRLFLKEEIHLRRVHTTERFIETVKLREQHVEVTRTKSDE